jgi:uncharacterized protein YaaW (UPF0174 family)
VHRSVLRVLFGRGFIIGGAMKRTLAIMLKPILWGWAVCLTDGRELARFHGPGARWRALQYVRASVV